MLRLLIQYFWIYCLKCTWRLFHNEYGDEKKATRLVHLDTFLKPDPCHCTACLAVMYYDKAKELTDASNNSRIEFRLKDRAEVLKIVIHSVLRLLPDTLLR